VRRRTVGPRGRTWQEAGEDCMMRSFITYMMLQVKEDEMGGGCNTDGKDEKCIQYFDQET